MTPLEYGIIPVRVMRDHHGNPCIVYAPTQEGNNDVQVVCSIEPDGSMVHEKLARRTARKRFYRGTKLARVQRYAFTRGEMEYYLTKYCRHFRMERKYFTIVRKFGQPHNMDAGDKFVRADGGKRQNGKRPENRENE